MLHNNYYEITAKDNFDLGYQLGSLFRTQAQAKLKKYASNPNWGNRVDYAQSLLEISKVHLPQYIRELEGYAQGARVIFLDFWTASLEYETGNEHCTTLITNKGKLISHNEDWGVGTEDTICVLKKTVDTLTMLELFYLNTLGGNSASINSFGFTQCINTLTHTDRNVGIPRNVIARWFSEVSNIDTWLEKLSKLPRSFGYNHNIVNNRGYIWNIESTAQDFIIQNTPSPFVHTNHYLSRLKNKDKEGESPSTLKRYASACNLMREYMTLEEIKIAGSNTANGEKLSILNEGTIARAIFDLENKTLHIWLKREANQGFVPYDISFACK